MSLSSPHHVIRDLKPLHGLDPSMPDRETHATHILHISRANRGRGFPVCVRPTR
jgi:hypothetical protein